MSTKPILFNTDMVRALLDNQKTATRRVVKYVPNEEDLKPCKTMGFGYGLIAPNSRVYQIKPPYHPGDILYVRETWRKDVGRYMYKADYSNNEKFYRDGKEVSIKWRPSIHMPREAARIFLRVTDVRVERLHEITVEGMQMEGVTRRCLPGGCPCAWKREGCMDRPCPGRDSYEYKCWVLPFIEAWDSTIRPGILARYGWGGNPWVWVIEFERCEKPEED